MLHLAADVGVVVGYWSVVSVVVSLIVGRMFRGRPELIEIRPPSYRSGCRPSLANGIKAFPVEHLTNASD